MKCRWCGAPGKAIAPNHYGSMMIYHCTKCHHEWPDAKEKDMKPIYPFKFNLNLRNGTIKVVAVHGQNEKEAYENARWLHNSEGTVVPPIPKVK